MQMNNGKETLIPGETETFLQATRFRGFACQSLRSRIGPIEVNPRYGFQETSTIRFIPR